VQTPPVPIPPVVLPLPATPALPVLPPINGVVVP
jgi:hypothetical protein